MTYSLATTGSHARSPFAAQTVQADDAKCGRAGSQQSAMATGAQITCKNPDGSTGLYTLDTERSRPGGPLYFLAVRP